MEHMPTGNGIATAVLDHTTSLPHSECLGLQSSLVSRAIM